MHPSFKESFYRTFTPIAGISAAAVIFSMNTLTSKTFFEIVFLIIAISLVGGLFIYITSILFDKYERSILNRIKRRFKGNEVSIDIIKFKYKNLDVFCHRTNNYKFQQNQFTFHIPRKYVPKENRKSLKIQPSNIGKEECFVLMSWFYVNEKRLKSLENLLNDISKFNE